MTFTANLYFTTEHYPRSNAVLRSVLTRTNVLSDAQTWTLLRVVQVIPERGSVQEGLERLRSLAHPNARLHLGTWASGAGAVHGPSVAT